MKTRGDPGIHLPAPHLLLHSPHPTPPAAQDLFSVPPWSGPSIAQKGMEVSNYWSCQVTNPFVGSGDSSAPPRPSMGDARAVVSCSATSLASNMPPVSPVPPCVSTARHSTPPPPDKHEPGVRPVSHHPTLPLSPARGEPVNPLQMHTSPHNSQPLLRLRALKQVAGSRLLDPTLAVTPDPGLWPSAEPARAPPKPLPSHPRPGGNKCSRQCSRPWLKRACRK